MERIQKIFDKAKNCDCNKPGCNNNHRLCAICSKKIQWSEYEGFNKDGHKSKCTWNIDHIIPLSRGGRDTIDNCQAVHPRCNQAKADR